MKLLLTCCLAVTASAQLTTTPAANLDTAYREARTYQAAAPKVFTHSNVRRVFRVPPTGSMRPLLDDSHVAVIEGLPYAAIKPGDIVAFLHVRSAREAVEWGRGSSYLLHQVVRVSGGRVYTQGLESINNPFPPVESFGPLEFVGVVRRSWRVEK